MRVLHVISAFDPKAGGTVSAVNGLAIGQKNAGLDVRLLFTSLPSETADLADLLRTEHGVQVREVGPCRTALKMHPDLRAAADEMVADADVVHVHALWEQAQHLACRSAYRQGVPYVISPHGMLDPWSLRQSRV